uniref:Uncharacterized protein n=1 Tax=Knipowitschia caucasica TaxID=637954 RepID=A0AAV2K8L7_KNICA
MSLLHSKQRLSPTIYTTSSMSAPTQEQHRPTSPEIHPKTACVDQSKERQSVTIEDSNKPVEEKKMTEETQLAQIRSNEEYRSAECPVSHKESSVRTGSTQGSAQATSHNTHSSAAVKSEAPDPHPKPLHQITSSQCDNADKSTQLETPIAKDRDTRCDEAKGPSNSPHRTPASARRALFARRRLQPSAPCTSPAGSPLRGAEKEASPSSPRGSEPALACSSPGCHVSSSSESHRCLLTRIAQSSADGKGSVGPHRSQANTPPDRTQSTPPREHDAGPHPSRGRPSPNFLSHLPLHSQSSGRPPSLLIPIGGIHMIQARPQSFRPPSGTFCSLPSPPASPPPPHVPLTTTTTAPRAELSVSAEVTNKHTLD